MSFKIAIVTNILTPYRIPLFEEIEHLADDIKLFLMADSESNRMWNLEQHSFKTEVFPGFHIRPPGYETAFHINHSVISRLKKFNPDVVRDAPHFVNP